MLKGDTSDLSRLTYGGNPVLPERDQYQVKLRGGIVASDIAGGLQKQLLQFTNAPYQVSVNYKGLDQAKATWLSNFFDQRRGERFIATLLIGGTELEEFVVQVVSQPTWKTTGFSGSISVTLQVEPAVDTCFIEWADWAYQCTLPQDWADIFYYTKQGVEGWL